ncbi:6114_t:CDS:1, partial [Paraglomus occultum]
IMDYRRQSGIVLSNSQSFEKSKQKDKIKEFKKILGITSQNKTNNLEVETALPYGLAVEDRLEEDNIREGVMYYNKILPKNFLGPFNGGVKDRLPTKLINLLEINESELEEIEASKTEDLIEGGIDIEDYAILSYS